MEYSMLRMLTELGVPPAIVGLIVSGFIWMVTKRIREDINQHRKDIEQSRCDIENLRQQINNVEKDAMQRYVGRDDYLVWMQRIEAKLDYIKRHEGE